MTKQMFLLKLQEINGGSVTMQETYALPNDYVCNPAATFDREESNYWDPERVDNSLAYQAAFYGWALELVRKHNLRSIADLGCGTAAKLAHLHAQQPNLQTCGLDQPNAIDLCRAQYQFGDWIAFDLDRPDSLPKQTFDLLVASDVIEHLENPDNLLSAMRLLANETSLVLLSTPERAVLRGVNCRTSPNPFHVREWTKSEFGEYLNGRGLEILNHRVLPAFSTNHNLNFTWRAIKRWGKFKSVRYNQAVLARFRISE